MDLTVSFDETSVLVDNLAYLLKAIEVRDHNLWGHTFMRPHKMTDFVTLPPTPPPPPPTSSICKSKQKIYYLET